MKQKQIKQSNWIHVTFGDAESGCLKLAFSNSRGTPICLNDDLSVGPILDLGTPEGQKRRRTWWLKFRSDTHFKGWYDSNGNQIQQLLQFAKDGSPMAFWVGQNAKDQLGLRRVLSLLPKAARIWIVDFTPFSSPQKAPRNWSKRKRLPPSHRKKLVQEWSALKRTSDLLRIYSLSGKVATLDFAHYDFDLIGLCGEKYLGAAGIVGTFLAFHHSLRSDEFIFWRLKCLVRQRYLQGRGDSRRLAKYSIKLGPKSLANRF